MIPMTLRPGALGARSGTLPTGGPTDITLSNASVAETSADVVAANTVIGTLGAVGGTAPYTFSIQAGGAQFNISGTSLRAATGNTLTNTGSPYSVTVRVTDAGSLTYDEAFSITVTDFVAAVKITEFTLHNYDGSNASPERLSIGLPFAEGAVSASHTIEVRRKSDASVIASALDGPGSWGSDGSLQYSGALILNGDVDIPAGGSRTYEVWSVAGSRTPAPSGWDLWGHLLSETGTADLLVECTDMRDNDNNPMTPATRSASLNDMLAITTRRTRYLDSARIQSWRVWDQLRGAGDFADGHMKREIFGFTFRDGSGNVLGTLYDDRIGQDWWTQYGLGGTEQKQKRRFFPVLKHGGSTVQALFGDGVSAAVQLPGHSFVFFPEQTGPRVGEMRWWAGTDPRAPTLWCEFDIDYLYSTKIVAPFLRYPTLARDLNSWDYNPGDNFGSRVDIDGQGSHPERGLITQQDIIRLIKQSAQTHQRWLVENFAGGHCPFYSASWEGVAASIGDVANQPIPFQIQTLSTTAAGGFVTGEVAGLGIAQKYARSNAPGVTTTWFTPIGTTEVPLANWSPGGANDHAPPWAFLAALLTGRRVFRQMAIHNGFRGWWGHPNSTPVAQTPREGWAYANGGTGEINFGWAVRYSTPVPIDAQMRGYGWGIAIMSNGALVAGDGEPVKAHLDAALTAYAAYERQRIEQNAILNTRKYQRRWATAYGRATHFQGWENAFETIGKITVATRNPHIADWQTSASYASARWLKLFGHATIPMKALGWLVPYFHVDGWTYNPPTTDYVEWEALSLRISRVNASDTTQLDVSLNTVSQTAKKYRNYFTPSVGDAIFFNDVNTGLSPPTITYGQIYYIKEILNSGAQMRISETPGGAAFDFGAHANNFMIACEAPQAWVGKLDMFDAALDFGQYAGMDDSGVMCLMAGEMAVRFGPTTYNTAGELATARANLRTFHDNHLPVYEADAEVNTGFCPSWLLEKVPAA